MLIHDDPFSNPDYYLIRLRSLREYVGLNISQAAKLAKMNKGQYFKLEDGKHVPSTASLIRIFQGYGITHYHFFSNLSWDFCITDSQRKKLKAMEVYSGRYKKNASS